MKKSLLFSALLLSACSSHWPAGSYTDLPKDVDVQSVLAAISECAATIVPVHGSVRLNLVADAWTLALPAALARNGITVSDSGDLLLYVVATTGTDSQNRRGEGAFVRVVAPRGICSQYFSRDAEGVLQADGPLMVSMQ